VPQVLREVPDATVVIAATGARSPSSALSAAEIVAHVDANVRSSAPVVEGVTPGGLFLDQEVLATEGLSSQAAVGPMLGMRTASGRKVFTDAFPGFAVSFARYC